MLGAHRLPTHARLRLSACISKAHVQGVAWRSQGSERERTGAHDGAGSFPVVAAVAAADWFPAHLSWSALDVGQGLGHPPSPDPQHVNTADMPVRPAVEPPNDDPVTG